MRADRTRRVWRQRRIALIVAGVTIWLIGPLLLAATVDGYLDGRTFRESHASTMAIVVDRGNGPHSGLGSDRTMWVEFPAGGERRRAQVLLPASVQVGATVEIEYALAEPSVATLVGERVPLYQSSGWWWIVGTAVVWGAAITVHIVRVRRYRRERQIQPT